MNRAFAAVALIAALAAALALYIRHSSAHRPAPSIPQLAYDAHKGDKSALAELARLGTNTLPELIQTLEMRDSFWRQFLWRQTNAPKRARQLLARRIDYPNAIMYRIAAAAALGRLGSNAATATEPLIRALADKDQPFPMMATDALAKIGSPAVPALSNTLFHPNPRVRSAAVGALGKMRETAAPAIPGLIQTLRDPDRSLRLSAAYALGNIGAPAIPAVAEILHSGHPLLRPIALDILKQMRAPMMLRGLRTADARTASALKSLLDYPDPAVREVAAQLLRFIPKNRQTGTDNGTIRP